MTKTRAEEGSVPVTITDDDRSLLEQEIEDGYTPVRKLLGENAALSAEVARLRAELGRVEMRAESAYEVPSLKHELATANALLERVTNGEGTCDTALWKEIRAHLSGLPTTAAPARAAAEPIWDAINRRWVPTPRPGTVEHASAAEHAGRTVAAERRVLAACAAMSLCDDDPDLDPSEPQEVGEDCYIYTDDQYAIAKAELARRGVTK
jgi:regulator of replication initiation timing